MRSTALGFEAASSSTRATDVPADPPPPKPERLFARCRAFRTTYLRPALLGAIDGLITSFVIVAAGSAAGSSTSTIALLGFASLVADGLSMGVSESISSRAQDELPCAETVLRGATCFASFVAVGAAPLVGFVAIGGGWEGQLLSAFAFLLLLGIVGVGRAWASREQWRRAVGETLLVGAAAGGVAYGIASINVGGEDACA